jgi:hypothetical protein
MIEMYITSKLENDVRPTVIYYGTLLRKNYENYQRNINMSILNRLKTAFLNMPPQSTPWIPASLAEYIIHAYFKEDRDAENLIVICVDKSIGNDDNDEYTRIEYFHMFCCIFPKIDEAATHSLFKF